MRGLHGKHILRQLLYRHAPSELFDRPKAGFAIPVAARLGLAARLLAEAAGTDSPPVARVWYVAQRAAADALNLERTRFHSGPITRSRK